MGRDNEIKRKLQKPKDNYAMCCALGNASGNNTTCIGLLKSVSALCAWLGAGHRHQHTL